MKNRQFLLFFFPIILCSVFSSRAQFSLGLELGSNRNALYTSVGYRDYTKYAAIKGFSIGVPVRYDFNTWFGFQAVPQLIQKGFKYERTGFFSGTYQTTKSTYLQMPLMGSFSFGGQYIKGFLNLGGYIGYWAGGTRKGSSQNIFSLPVELPEGEDNLYAVQTSPNLDYREPYQFDARRDRRTELGLMAGIGIKYSAKRRYELFGEVRYYHGLSDLQKYYPNQIPRYNETYAIQLGCMYNFK